MRNQLTILFAFIFIACNGQSAKDTEIWEPVPKKVYSSSDSSAPDDAIVLFDGKDLSDWKARWSEKESQWQVNDDGSVTVVFDGTGGIQTKENFGSVQLHRDRRQQRNVLICSVTRRGLLNTSTATRMRVITLLTINRRCTPKHSGLLSLTHLKVSLVLVSYVI